MLLDRLLRDLHGGEVDLAYAVLQAVLLEAHRVGAERVGLDRLGAGAKVVLVNALDQLGPGDVQLLEADAVEDATLVELCPHGPVDDEDSLANGIKQRFFRANGGHRTGRVTA